MTDEQKPSWTFLTNHGQVLVAMARKPDIRIREMSDDIGITERAVQRIVHDLVDAGYVKLSKVGRRNTYEINDELPLRHPLHKDHAVGALLKTLRK